jgi:O-antigen/teichoic acid export membrane protein
MRWIGGPLGEVRRLEERLIAGFGAQGLSFVSQIGAQILLVPLFIGAWGTALYQDWLLLFATAGFLGLADVGMQNYFGNLMVVARARCDIDQLNHVVAIAVGAYAVVCGVVLVVATAAFLAVDWPRQLGIEMLRPDEANWTLGLLGLSFLCLAPRGIATHIYRARGDYGRAINQRTLFTASRAGGIAIGLAFGAAPPVVALIDLLVVLAIGWGVVLLDQNRRYPDVRFGLRLPSRSETSDLVDKARWYFVPQASRILVLHAPVLIIGALATAPGAVVAFTVARTLTGVAREIPLRLADVTGVEMSQHYALHKHVEMRRLYVYTGRLAGGVSGLLGGLLLALGGPLIAIWTRGEVPYDPWLIGFFVLPMLATAPSHSGVAALQYTNQPGPIALARAAYTVLGLLLCALLVPEFGSPGAAAGLGVAEVLALGAFLTFVAARRCAIDYAAFLRSSLGVTLLVLLISYGSAGLLASWIWPQTLGELLLFGLVWTPIALLPALAVMTPGHRRRLLLARASTWLARRR